MQLPLGGIAIFSIVVSIGFFIWEKVLEQEITDYNRESDIATHKTISKGVRVALKIATITIILSIPLEFVAQSWNMFKNQTIYKVATSETADKTVENINLLMDTLKDHLEGLKK